MTREEQHLTNSPQDRARRYLLGKMSEQETVEFESQFFVDHDLFEELAGLENELIDSFVRGELSTEERQEFEDGYLISPERRANVEFARTLAVHLAGQEQAALPHSQSAHAQPRRFPLLGQPAVMRLAIATMFLAAISMISWLTVTNRRLYQDLDRVRAEQSKSQQQEQELRRQLAVLGARNGENIVPETSVVQPLGPDIIALTLSPGGQRTSGSPRALVVTPAALLVRLQLLLEHDDYPTYRAAVENADGARIWKKNGLKSQSGRDGITTVVFGLPPQILKNGDSIVKLSGVTAKGQIEEIGDYRFLVARR